MCLIVFSWQPQQHTKLLLAANRDEFYARPAAPLGQWDDQPQIFAGRDLKEGGTWLGVSRSGKVAALTNIRDPKQPVGALSRGQLVSDYLAGELSVADYLAQLRSRRDSFSGFNLLLGDRQQLWFYHSKDDQPKELQPGTYGLSNATLNTPWPKLLRARGALIAALRLDRDEDYFQLLADRQQAPEIALPDTGVGLELEQTLSSVFITSPVYGTRASTLLRLRQDGATLEERCFEAEGTPQGRSKVEVAFN